MHEREMAAGESPTPAGWSGPTVRRRGDWRAGRRRRAAAVAAALTALASVLGCAERASRDWAQTSPLIEPENGEDERVRLGLKTEAEPDGASR